MKRVEGLLFYASEEGNVTLLQTLLQEDPLILDRVTINRCDDMPLHVASMLGHFDFVNEILSRKPQLARESDSQRRLPLHIASAKGHVEIVKALLSAHPDTCLARDRDGRNPLHLAAIKGRYEVVKELLQAQPHAARAMVEQEQETILHLCVKHNQLEVLKLLVESMGDHEFVNSKDGDGNNILHLAVADKQIETINFLLLNTTIEVNASNTNGETSMDILAQGPKDVKDQQIIRSLTRADAVKPKTEGLIEKNPQKWISKTCLDYKKLFPPISQKKREDWLDKKRNTLMVVASFIATMAFQVGTNPPSGVWQEDNPDASPPRNAGYAVMANNHPVLHHIFLVSNTVGFLSTLSIILLLISGLSFLKHRGSTWIMMVIMWIATTSLSITYYVSITVTTPKEQAETIRPLSVIIVFVWIGLMTLVVGGHMPRLMAMAKEDQKA
ncbi:ankyrin repeat-containing protein ITN1-like [Cynara cardunculus var. scolymus]|uniref:Ankyrin repeat-containing protein n=1 Tax=Cynara cardunculus var. scolymus TaxID=59895 RepID=A0A103XD75_CYNCS|nr:ankyrin repeat-containing protein ITN1-like [Cynara cardunculus var. scolymus]KVH88521.1 Ankyrin repeat-containing protein [Cynara cardunculus var. scolymus]